MPGEKVGSCFQDGSYFTRAFAAYEFVIFVFQESMPKVLISRPVLQSLGFSVDAHLAYARDQCDDADFSENWIYEISTSTFLSSSSDSGQWSGCRTYLTA